MATPPAGDDQVPRHLRSLTSLRAAPALLVFGYHVYFLSGATSPALLRGGYTGVSLFFVLSGFVLAWSHRPGVTARSFYRRRVARLYPAYLCGLALAAVLLPAPVEGSPVRAVLLVQAWSTDPAMIYGLNPPSWSLSCEAFFYFLFPALIWAARRMPTPALVATASGWWGLANLATLYAAPQGRFSVLVNQLYANPAVRSGEFCVGIAVAIVIQRGWRVKVADAQLLAAVAGSLVLAVALPYPLGNLPTTVLAVLLLSALASRDLGQRTSWLTHPWAVYAGRVSFAFYLVHWPCLAWMYTRAPVGAAVTVGLASSVGLAVVLHHAVERPGQRLLGGGRRPRAPKG